MNKHSEANNFIHMLKSEAILVYHLVNGKVLIDDLGDTKYPEITKKIGVEDVDQYGTSVIYKTDNPSLYKVLWYPAPGYSWDETQVLELN